MHRRAMVERTKASVHQHASVVQWCCPLLPIADLADLADTWCLLRAFPSFGSVPSARGGENLTLALRYNTPSFKILDFALARILLFPPPHRSNDARVNLPCDEEETEHTRSRRND